ncbi:uncharacterized protein [Apostichopus japonicus]|uniref:uncharacterized protein n=1 Tax=Stichopus japonicus TaxID=307972 RepID=UPI003AB5B0E0
MSTTNLFVIPAILWCILSGTVVSSDKCQTPQYLQLGKKGKISCNFPGGLYGTVWYNSSNLTSEDRQLICHREGIVFGPGYESGEYSVQPDGSLVINKVSTKHNTSFGVLTLATTEDDPIVEYVRVVVYGTVVSSDKCQTPQYLQLGKKGIISCNFPGDLYGTVWYNSSNLTSEDRQLISNIESFVFGPGYESGEYRVQPDGSLIINKVSTKHNTSFSVSTLATTEDDPIVEYVRVVVYDTVVSSDKCQTPQYLQLGKKGLISCNFPGGLYGTVWYNSSNLTSEDRQLISNRESFVFEPGYESGEYSVQPDGSLVINKVSTKHNTYFVVSTLATTEDDPIVEYVRVVVYDTVVSSDKCQTPQYLQLGKKGIISCNFPGGLYGTVWYNSSNLTSEDRQLISNRESFVFEPGYESGEYSVQPDGSLVINKVSTKHNTYFVVSTLATTEDDPIVEYVRVVVYDKPPEPYPTIDATGCYQKSLCFLELNAASSLSCNVLRVGEVLDDLSWKLRTYTGDGQISSQSKSVTTSVNELQSYHTVVNISLQTSLSLRVFVCAARSDVSEVGNNESTILVESGTLEASSQHLLVTPNEKVVMNCGKDVSFFVWKKVGQTEEIIAFGTKSMSEVMIPDGFTLQNSCLVINTAGKPTLGTYTCVYSTDGVTTKFTSTDVTLQEEERRTGWIGVVVFFVLLVLLIFIGVVLYRCKVERNSRQVWKISQQQLLNPGEKVTEEKLKEWCKKVIIWKDDTRDTHDGIVERLKEASDKQVDIEWIKLQDSFKSVEDNGEAVNLISGAVLPPLNNLKNLEIVNKKWQQLDITEWINILKYACHGRKPTKIMIELILLPYDFENKLSTLKKKPCVEWQTGVISAVLTMSYENEQWESFGPRRLKYDEYEKIVEKANEEMTDQTEGAKLLEDSDYEQSPSDVKA